MSDSTGILGHGPDAAVLAGAAYGPLSHTSEQLGAWFHVVGCTNLLTYSPSQLGDSCSRGGGKLLLTHCMQLPAQPTSVPYLCYGSTLSSVHKMRKHVLDLHLEATQMCQCTADGDDITLSWSSPKTHSCPAHIQRMLDRQNNAAICCD